jgi:hypothetical protein
MLIDLIEITNYLWNCRSLCVQCEASRLVAMYTRTSAVKKGKAVPLDAMEALGGRGGIAPTHSRPRH